MALVYFVVEPTEAVTTKTKKLCFVAVVVIDQESR
jgi:hypothetical protein